jgi:putative DNA-invertase from lambdoid prophage Rac
MHMAQVYGYARVSTEDQELGPQVTALRAAGVPDGNIVQETASGKAGADRPLYAALLARLQAGDSLVVWKVARLGRSTLDALRAAEDLDARGVHIVITTLGIDLKTPAGRLVFGMMCQIAEFERELIRERVTAGMAEAKRRGTLIGRRHTLAPHQRAEAARMHLVDGKSLGAIAKHFNCGRTVVHRAIKGEAA